MALVPGLNIPAKKKKKKFFSTFVVDCHSWSHRYLNNFVNATALVGNGDHQSCARW